MKRFWLRHIIRKLIAFFRREYEGIKAFVEDKPL